MKVNTTRLMFTIEQEQLQQLLTEVKETLATEIEMKNNTNRKEFSAADLWNIQRNTRYRIQRRSSI